MSVTVKLVGFGDDRPSRFGDKNRLQLEIETPVSVRELLQAAGIEEAGDLIAMDSEIVIAPADWDEPKIQDQTTLTIFAAIEGG